MSMRLLFWILMLLVLLNGVYVSYHSGWAFNGGSLIEFLLFLLLGWKVFGPPIQG